MDRGDRDRGKRHGLVQSQSLPLGLLRDLGQDFLRDHPLPIIPRRLKGHLGASKAASWREFESLGILFEGLIEPPDLVQKE